MGVLPAVLGLDAALKAVVFVCFLMDATQGFLLRHFRLGSSSIGSCPSLKNRQTPSPYI